MDQLPVSLARDMPPPPIKTRLQRRGLSLASRLARQDRLDEALTRPRAQFVCFHHVFPDQHQPLREFCQWAGGVHRFVSCSDAVRALLAGPPTAPALALTFDDGLRCQLDAARLLNQLGIKAIFYVCTGGLNARTTAQQRDFCHARLRAPWMELMDWSDAEQLLRLGHEIGCHTATHPMMIDLPESQLAQEIARSLDELRSRLGTVHHFAFPFGRFETLTPAALTATRSCHVLSCASAEPGCHVAKPSDPQRLCVRRLVIDPDLPLRDFRYVLARLSKRATPADNEWPWP